MFNGQRQEKGGKMETNLVKKKWKKRKLKLKLNPGMKNEGSSVTESDIRGHWTLGNSELARELREYQKQEKRGQK